MAFARTACCAVLPDYCGIVKEFLGIRMQAVHAGRQRALNRGRDLDVGYWTGKLDHSGTPIDDLELPKHLDGFLQKERIAVGNVDEMLFQGPKLVRLPEQAVEKRFDALIGKRADRKR